MLGLPLPVAYLVGASLALEVLAFMLTLHDWHQPTLHRVVVVTLVLGAVALAWASLWRTTPRRKRRTKHTRVRLLKRSN